MMGLVCMSLEEMERSVSTAGTVIAFHPHQDCGDVIFLTSGEIQSLYIYISSNESYGKINCFVTEPYNTVTYHTGQLINRTFNFILHTDPIASVPEFTISIRTTGGPVADVLWGLPLSEEDSDHETSQVILDTSHNSVYDNRLRVRGRIAGTYYYIINGAYAIVSEHSQVIVGIDDLLS